MNDLIPVLVEGENGIFLSKEVSGKIAEFEKTIKELKAKEDELKKAILEGMEANNIIKLDTEDVTISYIAPTDRETFDTKKFREDCPTTYDAYVKMSPVKSSIRIKVKS